MLDLLDLSFHIYFVVYRMEWRWMFVGMGNSDQNSGVKGSWVDVYWVLGSGVSRPVAKTLTATFRISWPPPSDPIACNRLQITF